MKKSGLVLKNALASAIFVPGLLWVVGSGSVFASTSVIDEITIDVPSSCSLTNTIGSAHSATIETGVYQENIGETTFKVFCNDAEGFAVYAVGYTNNLVGNTFMKPAVSDISNAIVTGTATSGDTSNWAMKLTAVSGTYAPTLGAGFSNYHVIPDTYAKVASLDSNTDVTNGSSFKSTYAAYVSQSQLADSYTGKVKYTVVHPASTPPPVQSISELTYMQDLSNLSADEKVSIANSMQDNTVYTLTDVRDNRSYQIAKLKDGNIWMAENLDLGRTTFSVDLNSGNSNLPSTTTIPPSTFNSWKKSTTSWGYDSGQVVTVNGTDEVTGTSYGMLYDYYATTGGTISGSSNETEAEYDICPAGWRLPVGVDWKEFKELYDVYGSADLLHESIANGGAAFSLPGYDMGGNYDVGKYGYYWMTTTNGSSNRKIIRLKYSSYSTPQHSIEFSHFERDHGAAVRCVAKKPVHSFTVSYGEGVSSISVNGEAVADGTIIDGELGTEYEIGMLPDSRYAFNGWSAAYGTFGEQRNQYTTYAIGASDAILSASTKYVNTEMQNLNPSTCTETPMKVYDNRDGHTYAIQQLLDGNCWMIENLDLGRSTLSTDLTSSNTNLATAITAATFNGWEKTNTWGGSYTVGYFMPISGGDVVAGIPYGTLYNYYVASAGTIVNNSNSYDATYDICPIGWRLPTGGNYGEVNAMMKKYGQNALARESVFGEGIQFAFAGYFNYYPDGQGSSGAFWSSTMNDSTRMYVSGISDTINNGIRTNGVGSTSRAYGTSVRCVIKRPIKTVTITYGTGVSSVSVNGNVVANGATITGEQGTPYTVSATLDSRYAVNAWSATSGSIEDSTSRNATYYIGSSDGTLSVSANYINTEMQDLNSASCTTTPLNVYDNRDGRVYVVQRLLDGKCWMMENLDLGRTELTTDLTSTNTNLADTVAASTFNSWKKTTGTQEYNNGEFIVLDGEDVINGTPNGVLYNYYATSAGTVSGSSNNSESPYDICPAGWRLPTGNYSGELNTLYNNYNSIDQLRASVTDGGVSMALAGDFDNGAPRDVGTNGYLWSSTNYYYSGRYTFRISSNNVYGNSSEDRYSGFSIRCVLK